MRIHATENETVIVLDKLAFVRDNPNNMPATVFPAHCPVCKNTEFIFFDRTGDRAKFGPGEFDIVRCRDCGLMMLGNPPTPNEIGAYYADTYYAYNDFVEEDRAFGSGIKKKLMKVALAYFFGYGEGHWWGFLLYPLKLRLEPFPRNVPGGKFLDIGCATGNMMRKMKALGWDVYGVDLNEKAVKRANESGLTNAKIGFTHQLDFEDNFFDAVYLNQTLEHILDVDATMLEMRRVLKPGGELLIGTPSTGSLDFKLFGKKSSIMDVPRHTYYFNPKNVSRLLQNYGFTIREVIAKDIFGGFAWSILFSMGEKLPGLYQGKFDAALAKVSLLLDPIVHPLRLGSQLAVKAQK